MRPSISTWRGEYASRHVDSLPFRHGIPSPSSHLFLSPPLSLETWVGGFCQPITTTSLIIWVTMDIRSHHHHLPHSVARRRLLPANHHLLTHDLSIHHHLPLFESWDRGFLPTTTTFPCSKCETEGSCPPFLALIRCDKEGKPSPSCLFVLIQCDKEGFPSPSCLFVLIQHDKEGKPSPSHLLILFGATRRGNPLHHIYLTLFDVTRGKTLPLMSVWYHLMWRGGFALPVVSISYSMTPPLHLEGFMYITVDKNLNISIL